MRRLVGVLAAIAVLGAAPRARADATGLIFTVAGSGVEPRAHDGEAATSAGLSDLASVSAEPDGDLLIASDARVWRAGADGRLHAVAGTGRFGDSGDGGPALRARIDPIALAALPGGGFLIAELDTDTIRMVDPQGRITTVAGGGRLTRDGVPASRAAIFNVQHLAAAPDGGFVYDEDTTRVRRVGPDGIVHTIAGSGENEALAGPARLHGQPATSVPIEADGLAVAPDGSVLIADGAGRIERVTPDGAIHLVTQGAPGFAPGDIAAYPDGGFAVEDGAYPEARVWRFAPDGTPTGLAGTAPPRLTAPAGLVQRLDGDPAREALLYEPASLAVTPDGGLVFTDDAGGADGHGSLLRYVAPATPGRLAVAVQRDARRVLPTRGIGIALTVPATVAVEVAGRTTTRALPAGASEVPLPGPLPRGRPLLVRVTATDAAGRRTFDRAHLYPRGWLPTATVHLVLSDLHPHASAHGCRRLGPRRVDCRLSVPAGCRTASVRLTGGRLRTGTYPCRHPRPLPPLRVARWTCQEDPPLCPPPLFGRVTEADLLPSD